ncbi:PREDICTED: interferon-like [Nipponia nippon]|nr:PREDICTED: interferon-like [Nipponia nippon]
MPAPATPRPRLPHAAPPLLLLLTALATALPCHHPRTHDATFLWRSLQFLRAMAPSSTQTCHHQPAPFPFPDALLHTSHPQQAAATVQRILDHLFAILSSTSALQHWDTQAHRDLLNTIHRYLQDLERCVPANGTLLQGQGARRLRLDIDEYFSRFHNLLRTHNHSACAWDHVRLEACTCFQHLRNLTRTMRD